MSAPGNDDSPSRTLPVTIFQYIDKCFEVCSRLAIWATNHTGSDQPVTDLVCDAIHSLHTLVHDLKYHVRGYMLDHSKQLESSRFILETLSRFDTQLLLTLDLLAFHTHVEGSGQVGALNALYARLNILDSTYPQYGKEQSLTDIGLELKNSLSDIFRECHQSTASADDAEKRFRMLRPGLQTLLSRFSDALQPRYVHSYKSLANAAYAIDVSGDAFSGSYGTVQKVNHKSSGESLAMKTFNGVFSARQEKKILQELGILEVCRHKNIVRLVQAFKTDDDDQSLRIVMAPWAPYTLSRFLHSPDSKRKVHCPWFQPNSDHSDLKVYRIMYELADAVEYLHRHDIKHKDLKPDNILIHNQASERPTALITDVGTSKVYKPGALTNFKDSTYEYLAPEQHAKEESSFKSDIWQLGCCFAALLVVAMRGASGYEELEDSFNREDPDCLCSIALEYPLFIKALSKICMPGNSKQRRAYGIVVGMLDREPHSRLSIGMVTQTLSKHLHQNDTDWR